MEPGGGVREGERLRQKIEKKRRTNPRTERHKERGNLCSCARHIDADGTYTLPPLIEFDCHFLSDRYVPEHRASSELHLLMNY